MDIPFDQFGKRQPGQFGTDPSALSALRDPAFNYTAQPRTGLDWPGLRARLAAAYATRKILNFRPGPRIFPGGSFAPGVANDLAAWRASASRLPAPCSPGVNLTAKADGKPPRTIGRIDAGADRLLVRGLS